MGQKNCYKKSVIRKPPNNKPEENEMRTKLYDYDSMHITQIPTTYRRIYQELMCNEFSKLLLKSFSYKPGSNEYMPALTLASITLEQISRLVYKNKDKKYVKLPEKKYKYWLFEGSMETEEEVFEQLKKFGRLQTLRVR